MKSNVFQWVRESRTSKTLTVFMALSFVWQVLYPTATMALTSGPAQEEFASFEPAGTTEMVDVYSGDFTYNIPLLSVPGPNGGYPINLAYHGGIGMDQESSWTGLGWNLNVGAMNRQLRGIPDDFDGDVIEKEMHLRDDWTFGMTVPGNALGQQPEHEEFIGIPLPFQDAPKSGFGSPNVQLYYNNYRGFGFRVMENAQLQLKGTTMATGVGLSYDSQSGLGVEPNFSIKGQHNKWSTSASISARGGLQSFDISREPNSIRKQHKDAKLSFNVGQSVPSVSIPMKVQNYPFRTYIGSVKDHNDNSYFGAFLSKFPGMWDGYFSISSEKDGGKVDSEAYGYNYTHNAEEGEDMVDLNRGGINYSKRVPNLSPATYTHDVYNHTGQGSGGVFRAHRSDLRALNTPASETDTRSNDSNLEAGFNPPTAPTPFRAHIGGGYQREWGTNYSGPWVHGANGNNELLNPSDGAYKLDQALPGDYDYEPFYYRSAGEMTSQPVPATGDETWNGDKAMRADIGFVSSGLLSEFKAKNELVSDEPNMNTSSINGAKRARSERDVRSMLVESRTNDETADFGNSRHVEIWDPKKFFGQGGWTGKNFSDPDRGHHTSEYVVTQTDGSRYTYGLPAYNTEQVDIVSGLNEDVHGGPNHASAIVDLTEDDHEDVAEGRNGFFSKTKLPAYAHSWLLTSVESADYIDITGDGPTADDYGYWVKFEYEKSATDYQWRVPFRGANFQEGYVGDPSDDMANFSYGKKELFYLKAIKTKTHVAVFHTSNKADGAEAPELWATSSSPLGQDAGKMKKLDKVELFTQPEYFDENGDENPSAVPIKTVHFEYDYSLCPGVGNNTLAPHMVDADGDGTPENVNYTGKLTLKKLHFTYQNSNRGALSPYEFNYSDLNPHYEARNVDRWGNYQPNEGLDGYYDGNYPFIRFPYTLQDGLSIDPQDLTAVHGTPEFNPDDHAGAWSLTSIELPTGGTLNIDYEQDDYAYVEDQKAARMFDIISLGGDVVLNNDEFLLQPLVGEIPFDQRLRNRVAPDASTIGDTRRKTMESGSQTNSLDGDDFRIYFRLEEDLDPLETNFSTEGLRTEFVAKNYLDNMKHLYFKVLSNLKGDHHDYVSGYAELVSGYQNPANNLCGALRTVSGGNFDVGFVTVKGLKLQDANFAGIEVHPFAKAAMQQIKLERSEILYQAVPYNTSAGAQIANTAVALVQIFPDLAEMLTGYYQHAYNLQLGRNIRLDGNSVIRLKDPNGQKFGGGVRVSKISLDDNWVNGGQDASSRYGQTYDYTMEEDGEIISSGVAYEPYVGADESALRQPATYEKSTLLSNTQTLFVERPVLESYYPGASVGYRKVTMRSIAPEERANTGTAGLTIENTAAPITVYDFYTPKDFPVIVDETEMNRDIAFVSAIPIPGVYTTYRKKKARSQGYSIVLNDMAGKMKSLELRTREFLDDTNPELSKHGETISKTKYIYHTKDLYNPDGRNMLDNKVQAVEADGEFHDVILGETREVFFDMHEDRQESKTVGVDGNLDVELNPSLPLIMGLPFPYMADKVTSMKTVVAMKIINRSGILKAVENTTSESVILTQNVAFDPITGSALLTQVTNEFKDPVYNLSLPAHWYDTYDNMGAAYLNSAFYFDNLTWGLAGVVNVNDITISEDVFTVGDEVYVGGDFAHVTEVSSNSNAIRLIATDGGYINGGSEIRIIRSGRDNLLGTMVGSVAFRDMPDGNLTKLTDPSAYVDVEDMAIFHANAIEYSDEWQMDCKCSVFGANKINDPFQTGEKGRWYMRNSYAYVTNRGYSDYDQDGSTADDFKDFGRYEDFVQFDWENEANNNVDKWISPSTVTKISPHGFELENKDALGNYSAALYGYEQTLSTAVANNAQHKEIAFDSFEDHEEEDCGESHFSFNEFPSNVTTEEAHTGRKSIKVGPGSTIEVQRVTVSCNE